MPTFISQVPEMQVRAEEIRVQRLNAGDEMQADGPDPLPIIQQNAVMEAANEDLRTEIRYLRELQRRQVEALAQQQERLQDNLRVQQIRQLKFVIMKKKEIIKTMQERERETEELERLSEQKERLEEKKKELKCALDKGAAVTEQVEVMKERLQTVKSIYAHELKSTQEEVEERKETLRRRQRLRMRHGFRSSYFWRYEDL